MKKFLAILMLLAMCFSCAAMAETTDEDLQLPRRTCS